MHLKTELGLLIPYIKSSVKDLGVIMESNFKFHKQVNSIVSIVLYKFLSAKAFF